MSFKALVYAYVLGGLTFIPLVIAGLLFFAAYTSVPIGDPDLNKDVKLNLEEQSAGEDREKPSEPEETAAATATDINDIPRTRKGWLTMRRTFEESTFDGSYVTLVRSFLDARSKDPKRSRPKDMWYVVLKGKVLYLYEDEGMTECEAAVELGGHDVIIYPEGLQDGELFAKRNAICLKPKIPPIDKAMPSLTKEMNLESEDVDDQVEQSGGNLKKREKEREILVEAEKKREAAREEALNLTTPWFIFVRSNVEMEDWYFSLIHASYHPAHSSTLTPLQAIFQPSDMNHLVSTLDEQPDVIPMRWLNALIGRIFFSYYRTHALEAYIIGRLMKKLSKVKRPAFLTDIVVTEVSVGNKAPTLSKPMLKELTKEGDAALEVHLQYKGEIRITVEATATINLGARFKSYTVKLVLAAVLKELEGNLLVKVKRPPSNRIWYAFTQTPRMVLEVEPIVSDRQITWGMILSTIESRLKEIIQESVVMPNMDDIAFFESSPYQHRGGIWPDASRHERSPSTLATRDVDEALSTASAPVPEAPAVPSVEVEPAPLQRSQSAEELSTDIHTPPIPPDVASVRSSPAAGFGSDNSPGRTSNNRRRSWFSSIRSDDLNALAEQNSYTDGPNDDDTPRGRATEVDNVASHRSHSTPNKPESIHTDSSEQESSEESHLQRYLTAQVARRSSSRHSSTHEHVPPASSDDTPASTYADSNTLTSKNPDSTRSVFGNPPSSPTGFLSTLKSRAGDKQALSNSAKEAMRKWGVNWGGLRKEASGGSSTNEEVPDHGSVGSRLRADSVNGISHKARASYAEVRAAVAERKGRDKGSHGDDGADLSRSSSPVAIPEGVKGKARAVSYSPAMAPTESAPSSLSGAASTSSASSGKRSSLDDGGVSKNSSPSISRTTTEVHSSEGQEVTVPNINGPQIPPSPIHVQPQAKMMTIPGIHASHRGDVMSMGNVAPQPQTSLSPESKLKNPAIQSVYRLWKSPVLSGQQPQGSPSQSEPQNESTEGNKDVVPLTLPPTVQSSPSASSRPVPPPLPPRSIPTTVSRPPLEPPKLSSDSSQGVPSASEALKSIATKDENTRSRTSLERNLSSASNRRVSTQDVEGVNNDLDEDKLDVVSQAAPPKSNPGPPLPPRRIQASA